VKFGLFDPKPQIQELLIVTEKGSVKPAFLRCTLPRKGPCEGFGFRVSCFGFRVQGLGVRVSSSGFRVSGREFRVEGMGFGVDGLGSRV